jgi:C-terminal processing protease CtpA/Prc
MGLIFSVVAVSFSLNACEAFSLPLVPTATKAVSTPVVPSAHEPYQITGSFSYTNDIINTYFVENAVALVDMYGFVTRNQNWVIPVSSQTLGYLSLDKSAKHGTYILQLPERPTGKIVDVAHDGRQGTGVQVFTVAFWPNYTGGPYEEGDDQALGWPGYLDSVKIDSTNNYEVIGGKLVVWAPDDKQLFPTGFGPDKKLFTQDDPVGPIPAGYTIVDLDTTPFTFTQTPQPSLTLYEPVDYALKDFSSLSYTAAFDHMFQFVKTEYAFNGIPGKQPDWAALAAEIRPRVQQAEQNNDPSAFYLALRDFTWAFKDGHTGLDGGSLEQQLFTSAVSGGYGFALLKLDDGSVMVVYLTSSGPAQQAGMKVGAVVTAFNGQPINDAIAAVKPWTLPMSTELDIRLEQTRYLLRTTPGTQASVTFANPGEASRTVSLTAIAETDSFERTSLYYGVDTNPVLPVDFQVLSSGVGYVRINSYDDDLNLIFRLFQRALDTFQADKVPGIIIDLRYNSGGNPIGLSGFLSNQTINMGQPQHYNDTTGQYVNDGVPSQATPMVEQYHFDKEALLVGPACYSACEQEAYGFSQVPGMIVVGQYPTSGTFADVAAGQIDMPAGISMQVPTTRFILPDGSLFLEGKGVAPTLHVPVDATTALSTQDVILQAAEDAILKPAGAGLTPAAQPRLMSIDETQGALSSAQPLENLAKEQYTAQDILQVPATFTYTITLAQSQPVLWDWGWCAKDSATLANNMSKIQLTFALNGKAVDLSQFLKIVGPSSTGNQQCQTYVLGLTDWSAGQNEAVTTATFLAPLNDGSNNYPAGKQVSDYTIYVSP